MSQPLGVATLTTQWINVTLRHRINAKLSSHYSLVHILPTSSPQRALTLTRQLPAFDDLETEATVWRTCSAKSAPNIRIVYHVSVKASSRYTQMLHIQYIQQHSA